MANVDHKDLTGAAAVHPIWYYQTSDPGAVGAGKLWLDTTGGATLEAGAILKQRNDADTGWTTRADIATALATKQPRLAGASASDQTLSATSHYLWRSDASGANRTITIPAAASNAGVVFVVEKSDSSTNLVILARSGSDTFVFAGATPTSLNLRVQGQSFTIESDGTSWVVIGRVVPQVSCLATASSTTTSTSGAETAVTLNTESWDTHAMHDTSTNNTRITIKASGRYRIRFRNRWASGGTLDRQTFVRKNGTASAWYLFDNQQIATNGVINEGSGTMDLVLNDYVEMTQSTGDGLTRANQVLANLYPEFEVTLVEPLA